MSAIREGQQLFRNLRSSFAYLLMIHIPLVATATLIPLAGYPLLYLPIHVVWLELIIHPTALLVFQEINTKARLKPIHERERTDRFFSAWQWIVVGAVGAAMTVVVLFGYERSLGTEPDVEHARAMALVTLVIASATLTATLSRLRTLTARTIVAASVASAVILVQIPLLAELLHVRASALGRLGYRDGRRARAGRHRELVQLATKEPRTHARRVNERRSSLTPGADADALAHAIARMQHDPLVLGETRNFSLDAVALNELHVSELRAPRLVHEHRPLHTIAEQRSQRYLENVLALREHDPGIDLVAVCEARPFVTQAHDVDDDVDPLLFDAERRDLGETERFDEPNSALERMVAAPAVDDHALAGLHLHGVGGQQIDGDLEVARVADLDHGRAAFDDALALLQQLQHLPVDR